MPRGGILKDQRTVVLVFAGPGPVMSQEDNKAETAAKITPGLAYIVQSSQDERDLASSRDLAQYLPPFEAAKEFAAELDKVLASVGHPGKFLSPAEAGIAKEQLDAFNKSSDLLDWRLRYYIQNPDHPVPRNYSTLLELDDALIFEADLAYGVAQDDQQNATPTLTAVVKLYKAGTMRLLWRHEAALEDKPGQRLLYDFKRDGGDLIKKYRRMMPALAQKLGDDYKKELQGAGLYLPARPAAVAVSTSAPSGFTPYSFAPSALPGMAVSTAAAPAPFVPPPGVSMSTTTAAALGLTPIGGASAETQPAQQPPTQTQMQGPKSGNSPR